jgi:pimeloyl-ACP methyl ester carboxylesterase
MADTETESRTDDPVPAPQSAIPPVGETRTVVTRDGRNLTNHEVGDPHGPLVIHNHGGPSSRLEARLLAQAASKNRLRLVCVDRPGIGRSSPQEPRTYAGWADDVTAIADALGHREFGVTGWSEGGPWALAAAAYIDPGRLRHVTSIAGGSYGTFGDNWAADHLSRIDALGGFLALHFEPGFRLMYAAVGVSLNSVPSGTAISRTAQVSTMASWTNRRVTAVGLSSSTSPNSKPGSPN